MPVIIQLSENIKVIYYFLQVFRDSHSIQSCSWSRATCRINPCIRILVSKSINCWNNSCQYFFCIVVVGNYFVVQFASYFIHVTKSQIEKPVQVCFRKFNKLYMLPLGPSLINWNIVNSFSAVKWYFGCFTSSKLSVHEGKILSQTLIIVLGSMTANKPEKLEEIKVKGKVTSSLWQCFSPPKLRSTFCWWRTLGYQGASSFPLTVQPSRHVSNILKPINYCLTTPWQYTHHSKIFNLRSFDKRYTHPLATAMRTTCTEFLAPVFCRMFLRCVRTVSSLIKSFSAIWLVSKPSARCKTISFSRSEKGEEEALPDAMILMGWSGRFNVSLKLTPSSCEYSVLSETRAKTSQGRPKVKERNRYKVPKKLVLATEKFEAALE